MQKMPQGHFFFLFHGALTTIMFVLHVQAQRGFLNIDCGLLPENNTYLDTKTQLNYESDASYIDSGSCKSISTTSLSSFDQQLWTLRSFPEGTRNCYTLSPLAGKDTTYLIRTRFLYGNYDGNIKNPLPEFDIYLGVSFWDTVKFQDAWKVVDKEIIHVMKSDNLYLCLVNKKAGVPFISAIELRELFPGTYPTDPPTSLMTYFRYDLGSNGTQIVRYKDDNYDRFWSPYPNLPSWMTISTNLTVDPDPQDKNNPYSAGSTVMRTAAVPLDPSQPFNFISWVPDDPTTNFYYYHHFAEIQQLQANESRIFNLTANGEVIFKFAKPIYLRSYTMYCPGPQSSSKFDLALVKTANSTLPPLINAFEVYTTRDIIESQTVLEDVDALVNIKSRYGVKKIWQGDPCAPETFVWDGIQCNKNMNASSIISLNLSSSGLTGTISPYISNLKSIQILDLSCNNLSGLVPDFLAQMSFLKVISLTSNNLSGPIPQELLKKNKTGSLYLRIDGNQNICLSSLCDGNHNSKKATVIEDVAIPVVAVGGLLTIIIAYFCLKRKVPGFFHSNVNERTFEIVKEKAFTFSELLRITNNFEVTIGEGGFGKVYLGTLEDGNKVAVKMLSQTSKQGDKEFQAEARLLMIVHHRNLVSLIGYCVDLEHVALIYEYMSNGDLRHRLSDHNMNVLTWKQRVEIAIDAAQGLDYLHNGCKPSILHRDLKTSNILLNERMQAKIADFGLSREFANEFDSCIFTRPAFTPGYLDPEFQFSGILNKKSDIYSFGIILLELISGNPAIIRSPGSSTHILQWITPLVENDDIEGIVDPRLQGIFDQSSTRKMIEVAMACASGVAIQRPNISSVLLDLSDCLDMVKRDVSFVTASTELDIAQLT